MPQDEAPPPLTPNAPTPSAPLPNAPLPNAPPPSAPPPPDAQPQASSPPPPTGTPPPGAPQPGTPAPGTGWIQPAAVGPRIQVSSVIGRTFDTFGREWSLFLVLAAPAALVSLLQLLTTRTFGEIQRGVAAGPAEDPWALFPLSVLTATVTGLCALACVVATDGLWRERPASIADTVRTVVHSLPRAIPIWVLLVIAQLGAVLAGIWLLAVSPEGRISATSGETMNQLVLYGAPLILIGLVVFAFIQVRLSLAMPVIALEEGTPGSVIPRTWRLTKGNAILLFACLIVIGLCVAIAAWGATMFVVFGENRLVAAIALALSELVTVPLTGIWTAIAWADLSGTPYSDSAHMQHGRGRWTTVAIVLGLGSILVLAGMGVMGAAVEPFLPAT